MYFGALAVGADLVVGMQGMRSIQGAKEPINLVFKDFKADFKKRPEGDVHFHCEAGLEIEEMVKETILTGERVTKPIRAYAVVPAIDPNEIVAEFTLGLSLKRKS